MGLTLPFFTAFNWHGKWWRCILGVRKNDQLQANVPIFSVSDLAYRALKAFCYRVCDSMAALWDFSKSFLASFPVGVCTGTLGNCQKTIAGRWEGGLELERFRFSRGKREREQIISEFFGRLEEQSQMQEVLDSSAEDYSDERYFDAGADRPVRPSYFN